MSQEAKKPKTARQAGLDVLGFLQALEAPPGRIADPMIAAARALFAEQHQQMITLFYSVAVGRTGGAHSYAKRLLITRCLDDLLVAFFLCQHGFFVQCSALIRPVLECFDLLDLFASQMKFADVWVKGGEEARNALKPSKVRKLLGEPAYEPIYSFFCETGSHPRMEGTRYAAGFLPARDELKVPQIQVTLGGSDFEPGFQFLQQYCLVLQLFLRAKILTNFATDLAGLKVQLDALLAFRRHWEAFIEYSNRFFIPFCRQRIPVAEEFGVPTHFRNMFEQEIRVLEAEIQRTTPPNSGN